MTILEKILDMLPGISESLADNIDFLMQSWLAVARNIDECCLKVEQTCHGRLYIRCYGFCGRSEVELKIIRLNLRLGRITYRRYRQGQHDTNGQSDASCNMHSQELLKARPRGVQLAVLDRSLICAAIYIEHVQLTLLI